MLLVVVAVLLINRNRRFLVGEEADPRLRAAVLQALLDMPEVARVTYLRLEVVGPRMISVIGDVDLTGDDVESHVAVRLRALEDEDQQLRPRWPAPCSACPLRTSRRSCHRPGTPAACGPDQVPGLFLASASWSR